MFSSKLGVVRITAGENDPAGAGIHLQLCAGSIGKGQPGPGTAFAPGNGLGGALADVVAAAGR